MPTKRVIILEQVDTRKYRFALWADVPPVRQPYFAGRAGKSAYEGVTIAEQQAITSGAVAEVVDAIEATTVAEARTMLQDRWTDFQNRVSDVTMRTRYGTYWDGTQWKAEGT